MIPEDLRYTDKHEWITTGGTTARIGITDFAQDALGDIVYVDLPEAGKTITAGETFAEVESTKSASEIYAPVSGTVVARNDQLSDSPELINADPYGQGWLIEIELADPAAVSALMDAGGYAALTEQS